MSQGIQVFNGNGTLQFDMGSRLMRTLTLVNTGTLDGSVVVSGSDQGQVLAVERTSPPDGVTPVVTATGNGVAWSFGGAPSGDRRSVNLEVVVF